MNGQTQNQQGQGPFPWAWWSFDLGRYRGCDGTYCYYPYESIPPLSAVSESLDWLAPLDERTDAKMAIHRNPPEARGEVTKIAASAARLGLTLPESFVRLMSDNGLQDDIASCTACYFKLSDDIFPCPGSEGGYVVRFYNDQQDVFFWYLYLTPQGAQYVLVTEIDLDEQAEKASNGTLSDEWKQAIANNTWICAPSFAEFVYRWWLENSIWFKLNETGGMEKLTNDERRYIAHYEGNAR